MDPLGLDPEGDLGNWLALNATERSWSVYVGGGTGYGGFLGDGGEVGMVIDPNKRVIAEGLNPQNPSPAPNPCTGSIPEAAGRAILTAADAAQIDPTLLSVTWRHESSFDPMPFPNPRKKNGKIVGYDVGPMQLSTNYYDKSPFTDGLPQAFTGTHFNFPNSFGPSSPNLNAFAADVRFNGVTSQNLLAAARAFSLDILPRSRSLADAAGLYRAGSRSGPYQTRFDEYTNEVDADRAYLDCLRHQQ